MSSLDLLKPKVLGIHLDHKEVRDRIESVRKKLEELRLDAPVAYLISGDALPWNVTYL